MANGSACLWQQETIADAPYHATMVLFFLSACAGLMASPCGRLVHGESRLGSRFTVRRDGGYK